jgi:MtN3 and saliva related transmembrane protein
MASFVPQALKIWRERDAEAVSIRMYVVTVAGFTLWAAYGIFLQSWPLVGSNIVSLGLSGLILGLSLHFKRSDGQAVSPADQKGDRNSGGDVHQGLASREKPAQLPDRAPERVRRQG